MNNEEELALASGRNFPFSAGAGEEAGDDGEADAGDADAGDAVDGRCSGTKKRTSAVLKMQLTTGKIPQSRKGN